MIILYMLHNIINSFYSPVYSRINKVQRIFEINKNVGTQVCINIKLCSKKKTRKIYNFVITQTQYIIV